MKEIDTKLLDRIIDRAEKGSVSARIGYFDDSGKHPRTKKTAGDIATINHEDAPSKNIPARPWIKDGAYEGELPTNRQAAKAYEDFQAGKISLQKAIQYPARQQMFAIKAVYADSLRFYARNADSTIEWKGFDHPLHHTGWLEDKIDIKTYEGD